jgi:hypothetical protein
VVGVIGLAACGQLETDPVQEPIGAGKLGLDQFMHYLGLGVAFLYLGP